MVATIEPILREGMLREAALLSAVFVLMAVGLSLVGSASYLPSMINFRITLIAVLALSLFSYISGILSFGQAGFMALGAPISATLTVAPELKACLLADLSSFLQQTQMDFWLVLVATTLVVGVIGFFVGLVRPAGLIPRGEAVR